MVRLIYRLWYHTNYCSMCDNQSASDK